MIKPYKLMLCLDKTRQTDRQTVSFIVSYKYSFLQMIRIQIEDQVTATKTNNCHYHGRHLLKPA